MLVFEKLLTKKQNKMPKPEIDKFKLYFTYNIGDESKNSVEIHGGPEIITLNSDPNDVPLTWGFLGGGPLTLAGAIIKALSLEEENYHDGIYKLIVSLPLRASCRRTIHLSKIKN